MSGRMRRKERGSRSCPMANKADSGSLMPSSTVKAFLTIFDGSIINADKVHFTGSKLSDKIYYKHTGYPGGIKSTTPEKILGGKFPERVLQKAIRRMMPSGPLSNTQFGNLKVYAGPEHPHEAQKPEIIDVSSLNNKNVKR